VVSNNFQGIIADAPLCWWGLCAHGLANQSDQPVVAARKEAATLPSGGTIREKIAAAPRLVRTLLLKVSRDHGSSTPG
jgi:hypothetical protein